MEPDQNELDEIISRLKTNGLSDTLSRRAGDVSNYKKDRKVSGLVSLLSQLNSFPKSKIPNFDFMRVKNQILDRIAVPQMDKQDAGWFLTLLPRVLRIGTAVVGSVLIVISLTLGTSVAALNSAPGQTLYPLKQVVENIQLKLATAEQKPSLQIQFATNRVDELQLVMQQHQDGQISDQDAQKIVASTVKDIQKTATAAALSSATQKPQESVATKLADLSTKLKIASIKSEGEVKIELEQTLKNIQDAGMRIEDPESVDNSISAQGKLTAVTDTYVSIGSAKFLLTKYTEYVDTKPTDLKIDQQVDIKGVIKDNKTYAQTITLIAEAKASVPAETEPKTETPATETTQAPQ